MSRSVPGLRKLAAAADDIFRCLCMLLAQQASGVYHSVVGLICHCHGVDGLFLSCYDKSLGVCSDVAFICAGHVSDF